jgi:uncharacterized protein DUF1488
MSRTDNPNRHHFNPVSEEFSGRGISFTLTDGSRQVRCWLPRSALDSRAQLDEAGMKAEFKANKEMIFLLAAQKIELRGPDDDSDLEIGSSDLFNVTWQSPRR